MAMQDARKWVLIVPNRIRLLGRAMNLAFGF